MEVAISTHVLMKRLIWAMFYLKQVKWAKSKDLAKQGQMVTPSIF